MKTKNILSFALMVSSISALQAQTYNGGDFVVLPNTILSVTDDFTNDGNGLVVNDGELYLSGNVLNDGVFNTSFGSATGVMVLNGFVAQSITGSSQLLTHDLDLQHISGTEISLENTLRVNGTAYFDEGVILVDDTDGRLIFEEEADQTLASDLSYVDGKQYKNGQYGFVFPSGTAGHYRPAEMSSPDLLNDQFSCRYLLENSDLLYPHANYTGIIEMIDDTEYWILDRESGNSNVVIGLSYKSGVSPSFITDNPDAVHVVRWDATTSEWMSEGGVHDPATQMIYTVAAPDAYGIYTLALVDAELANEDVVVYNMVTPNGNGQNEILRLDGLENFEDNNVTIVNRWGETVFEMDGYDNEMNVFEGYANKGLTNKNATLPDGTYFYVIQYTNTAGDVVKKVGYIHLADQ